MNFLKWKSSLHTACAENTEKRLKSQVKRHSIITKDHKIICFTRTKIYFFYPPKFCGPTRLTRSMPKFDSRHPRTDAPTLPTPSTLPSRLVKLMQTARTLV